MRRQLGLEATPEELAANPALAQTLATFKQFQTHAAALKTNKDASKIVRHLNAKSAHDKDWTIIAVAFEVSPFAQNVRHFVIECIEMQGGEVFVGPPPSSPEEKNLRAEIRTLETLLGLKPGQLPK